MNRKPEPPEAVAARNRRARARKRESGMVRVCVWIAPEHVEAVKAAVDQITRGVGEALQPNVDNR